MSVLLLCQHQASIVSQSRKTGKNYNLHKLQGGHVPQCPIAGDATDLIYGSGTINQWGLLLGNCIDLLQLDYNGSLYCTVTKLTSKSHKEKYHRYEHSLFVILANFAGNYSLIFRYFTHLTTVVKGALSAHFAVSVCSGVRHGSCRSPAIFNVLWMLLLCS